MDVTEADLSTAYVRHAEADPEENNRVISEMIKVADTLISQGSTHLSSRGLKAGISKHNNNLDSDYNRAILLRRPDLATYIKVKSRAKAKVTLKPNRSRLAVYGHNYACVIAAEVLFTPLIGHDPRLEEADKGFRDAIADALARYKSTVDSLRNQRAKEAFLMTGRGRSNRALQEALQVLGCSKDSPWSEVCGKYKALSSKHHPDHGGDKNQFIRVQSAWKLLQRHQSKDANAYT